MPDEPTFSDRFRELVDAYLDGIIDVAQLEQLESLLREDDSARAFFAKYAQTHTDIAMEVASRTATERVLARIAVPALPLSSYQVSSGRSVRLLFAASLLLGITIGGGVVGLFAAQSQPNPAPAPRTMALDFRETHPGTLADKTGTGTGFTHRLPGTGSALAQSDTNLKMISDFGRLEVTATGSDLNTRFRLEQGEFPGIRLNDLGFTGVEDFEVTVKVLDVPAMAFVGQFGIYAGVSGDWVVRGGLVSQRESESYRQFVVNTRDGRDKDAFFIGLGAPGDDLRMRLSRNAGKFSMAIENRTSGATSSLTSRHPEFLDGRSDIVVGLFACDPRGKDHKAVRFGEFTATVWVPTPAR
ncbi:hypothetical protein BH11PLA2_BH11PLA2_44200 [soil metagenome]